MTSHLSYDTASRLSIIQAMNRRLMGQSQLGDEGAIRAERGHRWRSLEALQDLHADNNEEGSDLKSLSVNEG